MYCSGTKGLGTGDGLQLNTGDSLHSGVASLAMPGPGAEGSALRLNLQGLGLGGNTLANGDITMRMFLPTEEEYQQALNSKRASQPEQPVRESS
ncbi:hypothetical protein FRC08_014367 [Ceratobasidium sp. 394]|nr:hypothetical protein FRC08_014367 [Ceratobasidium sp. 394]